MKRFQMRDAMVNIGGEEPTVSVRTAPQTRVEVPCRPCEEKRRRDQEALRESRQPS